MLYLILQELQFTFCLFVDRSKQVPDAKDVDIFEIFWRPNFGHVVLVK